VIEFELLRATEAAAIAAGHFVGRQDKIAIDGAAVDAMRSQLAQAQLEGKVAIGEGEKDQAPMLYIGERVGRGEGPLLDIAVDPIDGTTLASKGGAGALSVVAAAPLGSLLRTHLAYMEKLVSGPAGVGVISLEQSIAENIRALARAMDRDPSEITVAVLDRPRNAFVFEGIAETGARARLFSDGDIANALIAVAPDRPQIDLLAGIGGAPEGVVTACAVKALGGEMHARVWIRDRQDAQIAADEELDPKKILSLRDLCTSDGTFFAATGVTDGELLDGVRYLHGQAHVSSIVISGFTRTSRVISSRHHVDHFESPRERTA